MTSRIKLRCLALLLALTCPLAAPAATPPAPVPTPPAHATDAFLAQLAGRWDLPGTLGGKPVHYHGEARWVLQDTWLQLNLIDAGAAPGYEASVYLGFDAKAGDYLARSTFASYRLSRLPGMAQKPRGRREQPLTR